MPKGFCESGIVGTSKTRSRSRARFGRSRTWRKQPKKVTLTSSKRYSRVLARFMGTWDTCYAAGAMVGTRLGGLWVVLMDLLTSQEIASEGDPRYCDRGSTWAHTGNKKRTVSIRVEAGCPCVTTSAWTTDGFHIPGRSCEHAHVRGQTAVPVAYVVLQRQIVERPQRRLAPIVSWCAGTTPSSDRGCRRAEAADEQSWQWAS